MALGSGVAGRGERAGSGIIGACPQPAILFHFLARTWRSWPSGGRGPLEPGAGRGLTPPLPPT